MNLRIRAYDDQVDRAAMIALYRAAWHSAYDAVDGADAIDRLIAMLLQGEPPQMFDLPDTDIALVAVRDDAVIVGGLRAHPREGIVHLSGAYVHPECLGIGIGSAMLSTLLRHYPPATVWRADVRPSSIGARNFYARHGFVPVGLGHTNVGADYWVETMELERAPG